MRHMRTAAVVCLVLVSAAPVAGARRRPAVMTYEGFRATEAGAELFLRLAGSCEQPLVQPGAGSVDLVLRGVRPARRFRALDARYFATPVRTVETRRRGHDLVVHVTLKQPIEPRLEVREEQGGAVVALLFPPGAPDREPPPNPRRTGALGGAGPGTEDLGDAVCRRCRELEVRDPAAARQSGCAAECARRRAAQPAPAADANARDRQLCLDDCQHFREQDSPDEQGYGQCVEACEQTFPSQDAPASAGGAP